MHFTPRLSDQYFYFKYKYDKYQRLLRWLLLAMFVMKKKIIIQ